jgi:hypothetical protein
MAPALAGSMNMRYLQFLRLDFCGTALYICAYFSAGYIGSDVLGALTKGYRTMGGVVTSILIVAAIFYAAFQIRSWMKARALRTAPSVLPADVLGDVEAGKAIVYDVRSHGYYDPKAVRIQGSRRLDPNALHHWRFDELPVDRKVYLYCT